MDEFSGLLPEVADLLRFTQRIEHGANLLSSTNTSCEASRATAVMAASTTVTTANAAHAGASQCQQADPLRLLQRMNQSDQVQPLQGKRQASVLSESQNNTSAKRGRAGRPSIEQLFPGIVATTQKFVEESGFEAHRRRQELTGSCGTTMQRVRNHLLQVVPGLKEHRENIGLATIRRWMKAPSVACKSAIYYKGYIDAKVPRKENSKRSENSDEHYYSSRVSYALQAVSRFPSSSVAFSVDNKNKLRISSCTTAVDRRCQVTRIYPTADSPNYWDHDFPNPGYLITPAGYMGMMPPNPPQLTYDKLGRQTYSLPQRSSIDVINRGPRTKTNIASHASDLTPLIQASQKSCVTILADGGADFNANHLTNQWYYMKLFRDLDLDVLLATAYCPGFSARNPIEHVWSVLTRASVSIYLPDRLPGEATPPQQRLTVEERDLKEQQVFDAALRQLDRYWTDLNYGGVKINVSHRPSSQKSTPYDTDAQERIHKLLTGPYKDIKKANITADMEFFKTHVDRRKGMIIFSKCLPPEQCAHCAEQPIRNIEAVHLYKKFPSPIPSSVHPGHFVSFIEALSMDPGQPDANMPSTAEKQLGTCPTCSYLFTSKSDRQNHARLFHPQRQRNR